MSKSNLTQSDLATAIANAVTAAVTAALAPEAEVVETSTTTPASKGKGKKRTAKKAAASTTTKESAVRTLTKKTRVEFIEAHEWAQNLESGTRSVSAMSTLVLTQPKKFPLADGWKVATFREAKAAGLTTSEFVEARGPVAVAAKPASGKANTRKGKKASKKAAAPKVEALPTTYSGLMALAQTRNVKGRSSMNSAQLTAALS